MFCSTRLKDELGSRVLYLLEWFDDCQRFLHKEGITTEGGEVWSGN